MYLYTYCIYVNTEKSVKSDKSHLRTTSSS